MEITTQRLVLREMRESDLDAYYEIYTNVAFHRYEPSGTLSKEEIRQKLLDYFERMLAQPRTFYRFVITHPGEDKMLGSVNLSLNNTQIREWEIGWGLHPAYWGRGYAPEAAREALRYAFDVLQAHRVVAFCHVDNRPSTRVMEKIGMRCEGRLRQVRWLYEQWWDEYVYAILEGEMK